MKSNREIEVKVYNKTPDSKPIILKTKKGKRLLDLLRENDIAIDNSCFGLGKCGKCKVRILNKTAKITSTDMRHISSEDIAKGYRLACMYILSDDTSVCIPIYNLDKIEAKESNLKGSKAVKTKKYGIGIDIGTTTLALALVELEPDEAYIRSEVVQNDSANKTFQSENFKTSFLEKGEDDYCQKIIATVTGINHQRSYGADVISRIKASTKEGKKLQEIVQTDIKALIQELLAKADCSISQIKKVAVAGNTTMLHLLRGYKCSALGIYPYTPISVAIENIKVGDLLNLLDNEPLKEELEEIPVTILPGFTPFVGADILSGLYAERPWKKDRRFIFLDLGTNGEMVAGYKDQIWVTSTAAGPVFEGGGIRCGVPGIPGAIARAEFENGELSFFTIANKAPIGICGTGVLEIVNALVKEGIVDKTGLLAKEYFDNGYPICKAEDGKEIVITQEDVRQVQMAKAAISVGLDTIYEKIKQQSYDDKISYTEDEKPRYQEKNPHVIIAGGFGTSLSIERIKNLKMIPDKIVGDSSNIYFAGNTALKGTARYLCIEARYGSQIAQEALCLIAKSAKEIELSEDESFADKYYEAMNF